jgi:hypothetical protein
VYFAGGYSASDGTPIGTVSRVFAGNWTEWSTITLDDIVLSGAIDEVSGFVYLATVGGTVLKLATSNFTVVDQLDASDTFHCAIIDLTGVHPLTLMSPHSTIIITQYPHLKI